MTDLKSLNHTKKPNISANSGKRRTRYIPASGRPVKPNPQPAEKSVFIAMALCHPDGQALQMDPILLSLFNVLSEQPVNLNLFERLFDSQERRIIQEKLETFSTVRNLQAVIPTNRKRVISVHLNIHKIQTDNTPYLLFLFYGLEKRNLRQQETEARYHLIFNNVPVGITITDMNGNFYGFNPAFSEMIGYSACELRELKAAALYQYETDRKPLVASIYQNQSIRNYETTLVRKDGQIIHVLLNADMLDFGYLENAMLSSIRDITPMKKIEATVTKERDFSEAVLDTSDSLIMVYDQQGYLIKFNKACEKTTGYTLQELTNQPFWELLAQNPEETRERIDRIIQTRAFETFECYWKTKNGRTLLIKWASTLLVDEGGSDYIVSTGSDITERRKAHLALRHANEELELSLQRLEEHNHAITQLAHMESLLQGCRTVEEVCTICAQFVQNICPETSGAVYLINHSKNHAEAQEVWGDETISQKMFTPTNCWSVRRSHPNVIDAKHRGLPCPHINDVPNGQYLCIPMEANGEMLGILHVSYLCNLATSIYPAECMPYFGGRMQLLTTAAETTALSLSNIMLQNTLRQQSIRDVLTGIYNRRYMIESLYRELSRAQREQVPVSVLMFDIDFFKDFNDTYGHDGGDTLLRHLGEFLMQHTRGEDIVCRYGGEEFVVVLPNTSQQLAVQKANTLRIGVSKLEISHLGSLMRTCTISIGVATYPENGKTTDELIKSADDSLYAAKRKGRNRVEASTV